MTSERARDTGRERKTRRGSPIMNKPILTLIAAVAIATAIAMPLAMADRKAKAQAPKCNMFSKYDKKTKTCQKR